MSVWPSKKGVNARIFKCNLIFLAVFVFVKKRLKSNFCTQKSLYLKAGV